MHEDLRFDFSASGDQVPFRDLYMAQCRVKGDPDVRHEEEAFDARSHVMVIWRGDLCIGGARLTIRGPREPRPLPLELGGFLLQDHFPELNRDGLDYGELSRFTLLPEFRRRSTILEMFRQLQGKALELSVDRMFAAAPLANLRLYRQCCAAVGMPHYRIRQDIQLPLYCTFDGLEDFIFEAAVSERGVDSVNRTANARQLEGAD
jgi:hypothetical protein